MRISGIVKRGKHLAKARGMATANIETQLIKGVYVGLSGYGGCLLYVDKPPKTEVHIIGFNGNLYDKILDVWDIKKVPQVITDLACAINKEK